MKKYSLSFPRQTGHFFCYLKDFPANNILFTETTQHFSFQEEHYL